MYDQRRQVIPEVEEFEGEATEGERMNAVEAIVPQVEAFQSPDDPDGLRRYDLHIVTLKVEFEQVGNVDERLSVDVRQLVVLQSQGLQFDETGEDTVCDVRQVVMRQVEDGETSDASEGVRRDGLDAVPVDLEMADLRSVQSSGRQVIDEVLREVEFLPDVSELEEVGKGIEAQEGAINRVVADAVTRQRRRTYGQRQGGVQVKGQQEGEVAQS